MLGLAEAPQCFGLALFGLFELLFELRDLLTAFVGKLVQILAALLFFLELRFEPLRIFAKRGEILLEHRQALLALTERLFFARDLGFEIRHGGFERAMCACCRACLRFEVHELGF